MTTTPIRVAEPTRLARLSRRLVSPIERMRVGTKLLLLAMLPVCCVAALGVVSAVSDFRNADRLSSYRAMARLSFVLEPLATDLDHERRAAVLVRVWIPAPRGRSSSSLPSARPHKHSSARASMHAR